MTNLYQQLRLLRVRVNTIIDLNLVSDNLIPETLKTAYDEDSEEIGYLLGMKDEQIDDFDIDNVVQWIEENNKEGFLVLFDFPNVRRINETQRHISWNICTQQWFYAKSYKSVLEKVVKYAIQREKTMLS